MSTMTDKELNLLIDEMILQKIPPHWQTTLALSAGDSKERYKRIMDWLVSHRDTPYEAMDLV